MKKLPHLATDNKKRFVVAQEVTRKNVERAFGILKIWWGIIKRLAWSIDVAMCNDIMNYCFILQYMLLKNKCACICPIHDFSRGRNKSKYDYGTARLWNPSSILIGSSRSHWTCYIHIMDDYLILIIVLINVFIILILIFRILIHYKKNSI